MAEGDLRHDTLALLEVSDTLTNLVDFAGAVLAQDIWVFLNDHAQILDLPVHWIHSPCRILDKNLAWARFPHISGIHLEWVGLGLRDPRCLVGHVEVT